MRNGRSFRHSLCSYSLLLLLSLTGSLPLPGQADAANADYWSTDGNSIVDASGKTVRITGVNWFGMESSTFAPHGLWVRNYKEMLEQIAGLGFNTVRLPFSNELFDAGSIPSGIDFTRNPDLDGLNGLEIMDRIISHAGKVGLKVILDRHRPDAGGQSQLWYTSTYPEERWIADWKALAARYKGDATVIGFDLHNEPRSPACWGCGEASLDWRLAAQRAGNAILEVNPNLLIIVEGVELYANETYWWGGNLKGVSTAPVLLNVANRVVYSAHDYPASIYPQTWLAAPDYPANLPAVWDQFWGYIARTDLAPVLMGEFGSRLETTSDEQWMDTLVTYLKSTDTHWLFWSWNPNSQDTGGLLLDDWTTLDRRKLDKLKPILDSGSSPPPSGHTEEPVTPEPAPPTAPLGEVTFCTAKFRIFSDWDSGYVADIQITNQEAGPINGWTITWELDGNQNTRDMWNGRFTQQDRLVTVQDSGWNASMPEQSTVYLGFTVDYSGESGGLQNVTLNGFPCIMQQ